MKNEEAIVVDGVCEQLPLLGNRVLLAEHRAGWSTWLYCALRGNGVDTVEVLGTVQLARALYHWPRLNAAIIDIGLPAVVYGEFLDVLRERAPRLPLLFVAPSREPLPESVARIPGACCVPIPNAIQVLRTLH